MQSVSKDRTTKIPMCYVTTVHPRISGPRLSGDSDCLDTNYTHTRTSVVVEDLHIKCRDGCIECRVGYTIFVSSCSIILSLYRRLLQCLLLLFRTLVLQKQLEVLIKAQRMLVTSPRLKNCPTVTCTHLLTCSWNVLELCSL